MIDKEDIIFELIPEITQITDKIRAHRVGGTDSAERQIALAVIEKLSTLGIDFSQS